MKNLVCPYCNSKALLKDASCIYNRTGFGLVYVCESYPRCDSYVGVHDGTTKPKGSLANKELRELRKKIHGFFDALWRGRVDVTRSEVYEAAAYVLQKTEFHIGDLREGVASALIDEKDAFLEKVSLAVQTIRLMNLGDKEMQAVISILHSLYVERRRSPTHVLARDKYRGYLDTFEKALSAKLIRQIKQPGGSKVFFALTPAGCSAIGMRA